VFALMRVIWLFIAVGIAAQVLALVLWGHAPYLWVQGAEAAFAAVMLIAYGLRFRRHDPRVSRWPPLLPLAAIAAAAAPKDFCVASGRETPVGAGVVPPWHSALWTEAGLTWLRRLDLPTMSQQLRRD
jgi:hypothetical protein